MKNHFRFCAITFIACALLLSGCTKEPPKEKKVVEVSNVTANYTTEQLIAGSDLIVKGKILSVDEGVMTNPTNDTELRDDNGRVVMNEQIHTYIFEIDTVYKGTHTGDTVEVKTTNGFGLTPGLILNGEDETTILAEDLKRFDLEVGSECILTLKLLNASPESRYGYYVYGESQGVFTPDQATLFAS